MASDDAASPLARLVRRLTGRTRDEAVPGAGHEEQLLHHLDAVADVSGREAVDVALGALMLQVEAQRGFIAVRDEDGLRFVAARAFSSLTVERPEAQLSHSILLAALEDAGEIKVDDAGTDRRFADAGSVRALGLKAVLAIPLMHAGVPFGVLYLDNPSRAAAFDDQRRASASALAELVAPIVARELELEELRRTVREQVDDLRSAAGFDPLVGESEGILRVMQLVAKVAPTRATVLIRGETGTGKELVARAIHRQSRRAAAPFVAVNCGALPDDLVESELFGHERGAFTGADRMRLGRFEAADGGTLFLDEIGELPLDAQTKLLRVLEEGQFERVGATASRTVNVRVIAATHRDLRQLVEDKLFRQDLLFRIRVLEIEIPPLRERHEDVLRIGEAMLEHYAVEHGSAARELSPRVRLALQTYSWPGNVRELRNVIERAAILASEPEIGIELLPPEIVGGGEAPVPIDIKQAVRAFKRRFVLQARAAADGDHNKTAELLGVNAKYLYQLLKDLEV